MPDQRPETTKRSRLIRKRRINGLSDNPRMNPAMVSGACDKLTTVLKATAAPTRSNTVELDNAARIRMPGKSDTLIERRMKKATINA